MLTRRMEADQARSICPLHFMEFFDANDDLLFSSSVPASPGDGSLSFFGIVFPDAGIVRITAGNVAPVQTMASNKTSL